MKIIKQGKPQKPKGVLYTGTCSSCSCEIECNISETISYNIGEITSNFIDCPTQGCSRVITVIPKMGDDLWKI